MRRKYNYEDYHKLIGGVLLKKCAYHKDIFGEEKWLPCTEEYFYPNNKNKTDGLYPECRECSKVKATKWRKDNPEKYKAIDMKRNEDERRYEFLRQNSRRRRENRQKKEWDDKNKDKLFKYGRSRRQRKTHIITDYQWNRCKEYFNFECAYCGLHIDDHYQKYAGKLRKTDFHKEHVDDDGSNGIDNCVPSCLVCNSSKHTADFEQWYSPEGRGKEVYSEERKLKILKWITEDYKRYI